MGSSADSPRRPAGRASDWRTEWLLRAIAAALLAAIALIAASVLVESWPSFAHNGIRWFFPGEPDQDLKEMTTLAGGHVHWAFHAWPLIWATILTSGLAVLVALPVSLLAALFIAEFAPPPVRRVTEPTIQLLAGVPSVIYGLIGILVIGPWVERTFISEARKQSVAYVVQLTGENLSVAALVLMVMIVPIMIALTVTALQSVPMSWKEGSAALGVNRWRTAWKVSVHSARPAIVAATVLAVGRALGEAIMLNMVAGSRSFTPNPLDGGTFFLEPVRPMAAAIIGTLEGISTVQVRHTLYAMGAVLLVSAAGLSIAGWSVRNRLARSGLGPAAAAAGQ